MKKLFYIFSLTLIISMPAFSAEITPSPLSVVNKRMDAYNKHDLTSFLATYSEDVQIYTYPDKLLNSGTGNLKAIFEPMFKEKKVKVIIHYQVEKDSYVTNHETVDYDGKKTQYVSVYKVVNGLITEVRFIRD